MKTWTWDEEKRIEKLIGCIYGQLADRHPEILKSSYHMKEISIIGDVEDEKAYSVEFFQHHTAYDNMLEHVLTVDVTEKGKIKKVYRYGGV